MSVVKWMAISLVCGVSACTADSKGEQWQVAENSMPGNNESANNRSNNESGNNESSNNESVNNEGGPEANNAPEDPNVMLPRGGLMQGESCAVTLDCAEGLECVDVSEFEGPSERVCEVPECFCDDPATTFCQNGDCALDGVECVLDGCPDGYACTENTCVCDGPECQGSCQADEHCDWDEICTEGSCREARCETDAECPARYTCGARSSDRICTLSGTAEVGDDCTRDQDCASGYCYDDGDICVQPCLANAECGARDCAAPDHFDLFVPYCRASECGECADDEYCRYGECAKDPCPGGECDLGLDI